MAAVIVSSRKLRHYWPLYLLVLPSIALVLTFSYFPVLSGIYYAFRQWDGSEVSYWAGLDNFLKAFKDRMFWNSFKVVAIFVCANLIKMIPSMLTAVVIHRLRSDRWQYYYRVLFVVPMIIPGMVSLLIWKFFYDPTQGVLNPVLNHTGLMNLLVWTDQLFGWGIFKPGGTPAWLGDPRLVIPSLIFWGFPWVGVVGVLIYLAGLQAISMDVYESAEIDGFSSFRLFWNIELPLIMTQVRLNLILMIIGTLKDFAFVYILLGMDGGPGGVAQVPGLYMFRAAFQDRLAGYACALGIIMFFIILIFTWINNKYVRVEK